MHVQEYGVAKPNTRLASIDRALKAAKERYGSMDAYIREGLGLRKEKIAALQSALLE